MNTEARIDGKTLGLLALQLVGMPACVWLHAAGYLPFWAAALLGSGLMNLSFTIWHEASHANFSRRAAWNHALGVASSFLSVYPGYFARRREHLAHHRWEGHPELDPVFPRIQTGAWMFFPWLMWLTAKRAGKIDAGFLPITEWQKRADRLTLGLFLFTLGLSLKFGFFPSMAAVFLVPRLVIFFLHAYYICYLPHAVPAGGFQKYRVMRAPGAFWKFITVGQWAHGVHHRWPNIPWHQYPAHIGRLEKEEAVS
jgi:beta-carotene hydroxylase